MLLANNKELQQDLRLKINATDANCFPMYYQYLVGFKFKTLKLLYWVSKNKYIDVNLIKYVQYLFVENCKNIASEIRELNKWKQLLIFIDRKNNMIYSLLYLHL